MRVHFIHTFIFILVNIASIFNLVCLVWMHTVIYLTVSVDIEYFIVHA